MILSKPWMILRDCLSSFLQDESLALVTVSSLVRDLTCDFIRRMELGGHCGLELVGRVAGGGGVCGGGEEGVAVGVAAMGGFVVLRPGGRPGLRRTEDLCLN